MDKPREKRKKSVDSAAAKEKTGTFAGRPVYFRAKTSAAFGKSVSK